MTQRVRKAVIPVAGFGTRFLPATKAQPKEMLPVIDKPGLQYAVEEAVAAGIRDIILVTGAAKRAIEDHFDRNPELEARLQEQGKRDLLATLRKIRQLANFIYVRQSEQLGIGHAVLMAQSAVGDEPFVFLYPDDLLVTDENPVRKMLAVYEEYESPVLGVIRVPRRDVAKYGIIKNKYIKNGVHEVLRIVEKPSLQKAPSNLASVKGYVLPPSIFSYIKKLRPKKGGEMYLSDAVELYNKQHSVFACELHGELFDLGSKLGWLKANVALGLERSDLRGAFRRYLVKKLES